MFCGSATLFSDGVRLLRPVRGDGVIDGIPAMRDSEIERNHETARALS